MLRGVDGGVVLGAGAATGEPVEDGGRQGEGAAEEGRGEEGEDGELGGAEEFHYDGGWLVGRIYIKIL